MELKVVGVLLLVFTLSTGTPTTGKNTPTTTTAGKNTPTTTTAGKNTPTTTTAGKNTPTTTTAGKNTPTTTTAGKNTPTTTTAGKNTPTTTTTGKNTPTTTTAGKNAPPTTTAGKNTPTTTTAGKNTPTTTTAGKNTPTTTTAGKNTPTTTTAGKNTPTTTTAGKNTPTTTTAGTNTPTTTTAGKNTPTTTTAGKSTPTTTTAGKNMPTTTTAGKNTPTTTTGVSKSTEMTNAATRNTRPNFATAQFKIELTVKVNASFNDSLNNTSSELYKNYSREFKEKVTPVYETIPGFLYVEVIGFSKGSINVIHKVIIKPDAENLKTDLYRKFLTTMENLIIFNEIVVLDVPGFKSLLDTIEDNCNAEGICVKGFVCRHGTTSKTTCESPCSPGHCNHGNCYVSVDGKPTCKCDVSDDIVYGGDGCDVQGTQMTMSTGAIAGIAGGVGGGAILLLFIALGCMCCSRRKGKNPEKEMTHEDDVALSQRMERHIYSDIQPGQFNYGADIKDEYRYTGRVDEGRGYEEWLMNNDRSEHEPSGRRDNDFRGSSYSGNWGRNHGDDRRGDNASMEPASMFGRGMRPSGIGSSQYSYPDDVPADYDQDDKRQIIPHPRDQSRENPYTRMPTGQPPSRPQSSLLSSNYNQSGNVYSEMNTDEQYAIKRPNYR